MARLYYPPGACNFAAVYHLCNREATEAKAGSSSHHTRYYSVMRKSNLRNLEQMEHHYILASTTKAVTELSKCHPLCNLCRRYSGVIFLESGASLKQKTLAKQMQEGS